MSWTKTEIHDLLIRQKAFFQTGKTLSGEDLRAFGKVLDAALSLTERTSA